MNENKFGFLGGDIVYLPVTIYDVIYENISECLWHLTLGFVLALAYAEIFMRALHMHIAE